MTCWLERIDRAALYKYSGVHSWSLSDEEFLVAARLYEERKGHKAILELPKQKLEIDFGRYLGIWLKQIMEDYKLTPRKGHKDLPSPTAQGFQDLLARAPVALASLDINVREKMVWDIKRTCEGLEGDDRRKWNDKDEKQRSRKVLELMLSTYLYITLGARARQMIMELFINYLKRDEFNQRIYGNLTGCFISAVDVNAPQDLSIESLSRNAWMIREDVQRVSENPQLLERADLTIEWFLDGLWRPNPEDTLKAMQVMFSFLNMSDSAKEKILSQ